MTFLAIAHARGCILALSDRREGVAQSDPSEVAKCHLSDTGEIYMSLSGDGEFAGRLLGDLRLRRPSGADIFREIDGMAAELFAMQISGEVAGHPIVLDGDEFKVYSITIAHGIPVYYQLTDAVLADGDAGAVALCKRLARDIPMSDMPCEAAARCLHTMASYIAETVESVGDRDKFGFDMVVFSKPGTAMQLRRSTDTMGSIHARFEPSGTGPLFGPDEVT